MPRTGACALACKTQPTLTTLAEIKRVTKQPFKVEVVPAPEFEELLAAVYMRDASEAKQMVADIGDHFDLASLADSVPETEDLLDQQDAPIVRLINAVLQEAIREGASDVHIETFEKFLQVRFRIDGVMREVVNPKRALAPLLVSRIKVMAKLDIAEKRIPQDGRIPLRIGGREVDVRVSTLPTGNGERGGAEAARQASRRLGTHPIWAWMTRRWGGCAMWSPARTASFWSPGLPVPAKPPHCMRPWAS